MGKFRWDTTEIMTIDIQPISLTQRQQDWTDSWLKLDRCILVERCNRIVWPSESSKIQQDKVILSTCILCECACICVHVCTPLCLLVYIMCMYRHAYVWCTYVCMHVCTIIQYNIRLMKMYVCTCVTVCVCIIVWLLFFNFWDITVLPSHVVLII